MQGAPWTGVRVAATRHLIITADDFGLDLAINEAVEQAFTGGVLTAASLMVGQPASGDAVERARRLPGLRVGLHVTLTGARPMLAPQRLPEFPDLPTVAETIPGFSAAGWLIFAAPVGTPAAIISKVSADLAKVVTDPAVKKKLAATSYRYLREDADLAKAGSTNTALR